MAEVMNLDLPAAHRSLVATMAVAVVQVSGPAYAFASPLVGAIGVFLTGSVASSNALFGSMQKMAAEALGLSDILLAAAGSAGGTAGKMISPQSVAIAAAVGLAGQEGLIMRRALRYAVPYVAVLGGLVSACAAWGGRLIP